MKYRLSFPFPSEQIVRVQIITQAQPGKLRFCLPYWRPGRYARQEYPRNLNDLQAFGPQQQEYAVAKVSTHIWEVAVSQAGELNLQYHYFANQQDAGGSYYDADHIYVNPINLALYREGQLNRPCEMQLDLPEGFVLGGGLQASEGSYRFKDYHQFVDSPFMAAKDLIHHTFEVQGIPIHLWFMGDCNPDLIQMERDIARYSAAQMTFFGHYPVEDYHYLFYLLPQPYRHGVEHYNSTVIVMGPGYHLMSPNMYQSFLEISSHEFFHTWNVKSLRPADMWPYDYSQENYSRLHYITEGVTTYYGDLMLWKCGVWGIQRWVDSINGELKRHYVMGGKDFVSLSNASFDSWVNGYDTTGMPNRRISFYTKGYLVSMLLDYRIRKATDQHHSLDEVIRRMYQEIARQGKAYTREDYQRLIEDISGQSFAAFFADYVDGTASLEPMLEEMGSYYGLQLRMMPLGNLSESAWGIKVNPVNHSYQVEQILPHSPWLEAGLHQGDEIISINGQKLVSNWDELLAYYWKSEEIVLHVFHKHKLRELRLNPSPQFPYRVPQFWLTANQEEPQRSRINHWRSIPEKTKV